MDFKRKLVKTQINGEDVWLRQPNAALRIAVRPIVAGDESDSDKNLRIVAEVVACCLADEAGKPVFDSGDNVLTEMDASLFDAVFAAIGEAFPQGKAAKNSESVQNSSLPLTSQES